MKCPICDKDIEAIPGHRQKKYCGDACKQTAYRIRQEEMARQAEELARQELEVQQKEALRKAYGDLLPETIELLYQLRHTGHSSLVQSIGKAIVAEREQAKQTDGQKRNKLIEDIMLLGEKIGFTGMDLGRLNYSAGPATHAIMGGVESWSSFVSQASIGMLEEAYGTAYYLAEGYEKSRKRLKELSEQS